MQGNEFAFKVPKVRKRWQSLYCTESISDLDEIWESSDSNNDCRRLKPTNSVAARRSRSQVPDEQFLTSATTDIVQHVTSDSNDTTEKVKSITDNDTTVECDFYPNKELFLTISEDEHCFSVPQNKYTMGLLQELSTSPHPPDNKSLRETFCQNESTNIFMSSRSPSPQKPCNESNQPWFNCNEKVFKHESVKTMGECGFSSPQSPDVLIVRDESMANADSEESDVDWESLTPPACRSPRDHTVPDLDDLSTITPPGDFLMYPYGHLSSVLQIEDQVLTEQDDIMNEVSMHPYFLYSATDQVLPDLYF